MKNLARTLSDRVIALIEEARRKVGAVANLAQVYTNYEIGRQIVEEEQGGKRRAGYGEKLLADLAEKLTAHFGRGWGARNLRRMRQFFLEYSSDEARCELLADSDIRNVQIKGRGNLDIGNVQKISFNEINPVATHIPPFTIGWTHYLMLLQIENRDERCFYEMEAMNNQWSVRQLSDAIAKQLFARLAATKDRAKLQAYLHRRVRPEDSALMLKDPYVLEFLGLPEIADYSESELEKRIIDHIQEFMLELGNGFFFGGRQVRMSFGEEHFYADLVFYNRLLRCFFVIDLKIGKVSHKDIGQMQMYVHYYDREIKMPDENPTIGILLCSDDNKAVVEMTLPESEKRQIFARRYSAIIPSKQKLAEIVLEEKSRYEQERLLTFRGDVKGDGTMLSGRAKESR